ncbi:transcription termination/antitermination NusG family protein [Calidifontibacillus erzurumensis]|uniref:transcription termination/antitermination NusG family protein n=1 Tax=Calidifontibacillus erzurumensis TaxID=2741433 RepID=UPI0035B51D02
MSYFAVNVKAGSEIRIIEYIAETCRQKSFNLIKGIVTPLTKVKKFKGEETCSYKVKAILPYIYIKIDELTTKCPVALYHFLKQIPGVYKILEYSIPEEEVEEFCQRVGSSIKEAEFEIDYFYNQKEQQTKQEKALETLNSDKTTAEEKEAAQKEIEEVENHPVVTAIQLIKEGKEKGYTLFQRIKSKQRKNKTIFRFPLEILSHTILRIDSERQLPNRVVTDPTFLLPHINDTLKEMLRHGNN